MKIIREQFANEELPLPLTEEFWNRAINEDLDFECFDREPCQTCHEDHVSCATLSEDRSDFFLTESCSCNQGVLMEIVTYKEWVQEKEVSHEI